MTEKEEIIKTIKSMTGEHSAYSIFYDWVKMSSLAIANACSLFHNELWKKREEDYLDIYKKYREKDIECFMKMFALLTICFENTIEDVLGEIYMKSGCYSKELGQFFTPYHLAYLVAETGMTEINPDEPMIMNEPSTGGGANIIAAADVLHKRGIDYQKIMKVTAQDLDWLGVYMTYVQLSMLGIDAVVVQGDTLQNPYTDGSYVESRVFRTPRNRGVLI